MLAICLVGVSIIYYIVEYKENQQIKHIINEIETGKTCFNNQQIDSALLFFGNAWREIEVHSIDEMLTEVIYWTARTHYLRDGFSAIDTINEIAHQVNYNESQYSSELALLRGKIYENSFSYEEADKVYDQHIRICRIKKDTNNFVRFIALKLLLYEKQGDLISPQSILLNYPELESILSKSSKDINISPVAIEYYRYYFNLLKYDSRLGVHQVDDKFDELLSSAELLDTFSKARICYNLGFILKKYAFDSSSQIYNDTILQHSINLYKKSINSFKNIEYAKTDLFNTTLGLANAYYLLDSNKVAFSILEELDTTNFDLLLKIRIDRSKALYAYNMGDKNLALGILKNYENYFDEIYYESDLLQEIFLKEVLGVKTLQLEINNALPNKTESSIYEIQRDLNKSKDENLKTKLLNFNITLSEWAEKYNNKIAHVQEKESDIYDNVANIIGFSIVLLALLFILGDFGLKTWYKMPSKISQKKYPINKSKYVPYSDIIYIIKVPNRNSAWFHQKSGRKDYEYITIEKLLEGSPGRKPLPSSIFIGVNQSTIVNLFEINEFLDQSEGILMSDGQKIKVAEDQMKILKSKVLMARRYESEYDEFMAHLSNDFQKNTTLIWGKITETRLAQALKSFFQVLLRKDSPK